MADMPGNVDALARAVAARDIPAATHLAHALKGLAAQVGGVRMSTRSREIEQQLMRGETPDSTSLAQLGRDHDELAEAIHRWRAQSSPAPG